MYQQQLEANIITQSQAAAKTAVEKKRRANTEYSDKNQKIYLNIWLYISGFDPTNINTVPTAGLTFTFFKFGVSILSSEPCPGKSGRVSSSLSPVPIDDVVTSPMLEPSPHSLSHNELIAGVSSGLADSVLIALRN